VSLLITSLVEVLPAHVKELTVLAPWLVFVQAWAAICLVAEQSLNLALVVALAVLVHLMA